MDSKYDFLHIVDNFQEHRDVKSHCVIKRTSHNDAIVTIAIPTYRDGDRLVQSVNSALSQVGFDDYNILIVDNDPNSEPSLDIFSSPAYLDEEERKFNKGRISYYQNDVNIGMCANWNRCVELCQAEYLVMLHADDLLMPNYLNEVMLVVANKKVGMLQTARIKNSKFRMGMAKLPYERFCLLDLMPNNQLCAPSGALYRVEYIRNLGGWNNNVTFFFDCYLNALFLVNYPVYVINKPLTYYRRHTDYPKDLKYAIVTAEYFLYHQILRYYHIPERFALSQPYLGVLNYCKANELDYHQVPLIASEFTESQMKWGRRIEKYTRIIAHWFANL